MDRIKSLLNEIVEAASKALVYKEQCMSFVGSIQSSMDSIEGEDVVPLFEEILLFLKNLQCSLYFSTTWMNVTYVDSLKKFKERWESLLRVTSVPIEENVSDETSLKILLSAHLEQHGPLMLHESRVFDDEMMKNLEFVLALTASLFDDIQLRVVDESFLSFQQDSKNLLGCGLYGNVFQGTLRGMKVAIKKVQQGSDEEMPTFYQQLRNEAVILQLHSFPGVIRLFGVDNNEKPSLLVMELAVCSLHSALHGDHKIEFSVERKLSILLSLCGTFSFLHSIGIVHRDIKPMNILMMPDGNVKVTDFGSSKSTMNDQLGNDLMGTLLYMAPELMLSSSPEYTEATDMYSFAVLMNEVMTEEKPIECPNFLYVMCASGGTIRPRKYDGNQSSITKIIEKCWSSDVSVRLNFWGLCLELNVLHGSGPSIDHHGPVYSVENRFLASSLFSGYYTGEMIRNMRHGKGSLRCLDGKVYEGEWRFNRLNGLGTLETRGSCFKGSFLNSNLEGHGVFEFGSGERYEGELRANAPIAGTFTNSNGVFDFEVTETGHRIDGVDQSGHTVSGECSNAGDGRGVVSFGGFVYDGETRGGKFEGHGRSTFPDGGMYEGEWKNNLREGHGVMQYANGAVYVGEWKSGLMHGHGVVTSACGASSYEGKWKDGKRDGHGVNKYFSGAVYVGEWKDHFREGRGIMTCRDHSIYDGQWKGDKSNGHGVMTYANGSVYEGEWHEDVKEGHGVMKYADGDVYDGEWKNDRREGHGMQKFSSGAVYDGEWTNGLREGHGVYRGADGTRYEGEWKNNWRDGQGVMIFFNNDVYEGQWKKDVQEGSGVMTYADGHMFRGDWSRGLRHGLGAVLLADGTVIYDGEWKNGMEDGHGVANFLGGNVYKGEWHRGKRHGRGTTNLSDGSSYHGEWRNDAINGDGIMYFSEGSVYEGQWKNNRREGRGVMRFGDGSVYNGEWKYDKFCGHGRLVDINGAVYEGMWCNEVLTNGTEENLVHYSASCDGCFVKPIIGPLYIDMGTDFALCTNCYNEQKYSSEKAMVKIIYDATNNKLVQVREAQAGRVITDWP